MYTVKLAGIVYVLHVFQKKSKQRGATSKHDIDLIRVRLQAATEHYSLARLMNLIGRLDRDVEIVIRRKPRSRQASRLQVRAA